MSSTAVSPTAVSSTARPFAALPFAALPSSPLIDRGRPELAAAAHLVRRSSLGVHPERVAELAALDWDDAVGRVLDHRPSLDNAPSSDDLGDTIGWWVERMVEPETGLTDRLAWFWHGLLTTNANKVDDNAMVAQQLDHLRANALGNFRTLLQGYVSGGALLQYLDASYSMASNPNENLARELMEVFTVGRGHYTEDDVRAAARALAGWVVQDGSVEFRREHAFIAPLMFMDVQAEWDTVMIVDHLCDHPATAARVAARLWDELVGVPLDADGAAELGQWWQGQELEIAPLVERILRDPGFAQARFTRPRSALEWYCAVRSVIDIDNNIWLLENLGQIPYGPPNVAGWPRDGRWLNAGALLPRTSMVHNIDIASVLPLRSEAPLSTEEILDQCSLFEVSPATVDALDSVADTPELPPEQVEIVRWRLALSSPEFNLQ